jgi:glycosyltransferase involved in cell wall biosynthesis
MISIVIPTKNNEEVLERCLTSLQNLDYPAKELEIIIVDGHSSDHTVAIAERYGCRVFFEQGGTISSARDLGVEKAHGEYIAFTDADCLVDRQWIRELIKNFNNHIASVGGPNLTPNEDSPFARRVGKVLTFLSRPGARYGYVGNQVREIYHNPTCNVMYQKKILEEVGGFNHRLVSVDDEELDFRIRQKGYRILYTPYAIVYHFRRPTWKKFLTMSFLYGLGRMQAIRLHPELGKWYYVLPSMLIVVLIALFLLTPLSFLFSLTALGILLTGGIGIFLIGIYLTWNETIRGIPTFFLLIALWFWGYGVGMLWGLTR